MYFTGSSSRMISLRMEAVLESMALTEQYCVSESSTARLTLASSRPLPRTWYTTEISV